MQQALYKLYKLDKILTALIISPYRFISPLPLLNIYKYNFDISFSKLHKILNKLFLITNCASMNISVYMHGGIYIHINILFRMYEYVCVRVCVFISSNCCILMLLACE